MFFIPKFLIEREKHINTDYSLTGWMLCVMPTLREDILTNLNGNYMNQINTVIKILFAYLSEEEFHETIDNFCSGNMLVPICSRSPYAYRHHHTSMGRHTLMEICFNTVQVFLILGPILVCLGYNTSMGIRFVTTIYKTIPCTYELLKLKPYTYDYPVLNPYAYGFHVMKYIQVR